jgi:hypothetical protein
MLSDKTAEIGLALQVNTELGRRTNHVRQKNTWTVLRALFARSGNRCCFTGCSHELINDDGLFVGEVCHLRAAEPGGARYDPKQAPAARRAEKNLILLCHAHHVVIDSKRVLYTSSKLQRMKQRHESRHRSTFRVERQLLETLAGDIDAYWARVGALHAKARRSGAPVVDIRPGRPPVAIIRAMRRVVAHLETAVRKLSQDADELPTQVKSTLEGVGLSTGPWDDLAYYKNPLCRWNWEYLNLLLPNGLRHLHIALVQLDVKLAEKEHLQNPQSQGLKSRLAKARREFESIASHAVDYD